MRKEASFTASDGLWMCLATLDTAWAISTLINEATKMSAPINERVSCLRASFLTSLMALRSIGWAWSSKILRSAGVAYVFCCAPHQLHTSPPLP